MSLSPVNSNEKSRETQSYLAEKYAALLENVKTPQDLITDSSIISLVSVAVNINNQKDYEAEASQPRLPLPKEGKTTTAPLEQAAQNIVTGFISKELTMLLADINEPSDRTDIFNSLTQGTPLQNPKLKANAERIKNEVELAVRENAQLENFTLEALYQPSPTAWVQTPLSPYSENERNEIIDNFKGIQQQLLGEELQANTAITEQDRVLLKNAFQTGKVDPQVALVYESINLTALEKIQAIYGLSTDWKPTSEISDWVAVNRSIINPQAMNNARQTLLADNIDEVSVNIYGVIIDALYSQKKVLNLELLQTTLSILDTIQIKKANQEKSTEVSKATIEETEKAQSKARVLSKLGIAATVIGAVVSLIAVASTILTAGLASPIAVATITVTAAMLTYTVIEATTGVTATAFAEFNEAFGEMTSKMSEGAALALKILTVAAVVVIIAALVIATAPAGGSAVSGVALSALTPALAKTIIIQGLQMAVRQMAVQFAVIFLMGSGVLTEATSYTLESMGIEGTTQKILSALIFALEMIAVLMVAVKASANIANSGTGPVTAAASPKVSITESLKTKVQGIKNYMIEELESIKDFLNNVLSKAKNPRTLLPSGIFRNPFDIVKQNFSMFMSGDIREKAAAVNRIVQMTNTSTQVVLSSVKGGTQVSLYQTYMEQSLLEKNEAEIRALIANIDQLIKALQSSTSQISEMTNDFSQTITGMLNGISSTATKVFNTIQG